MPNSHDGGAVNICKTCGTSLAEGQHVIVTASDDNSVTLSCRFPRVSELPRAVHYLSAPTTGSEYWYRAAKSPREVQDAHINATFGATEEGQ